VADRAQEPVDSYSQNKVESNGLFGYNHERETGCYG
jgi:hypothetical protein